MNRLTSIPGSALCMLHMHLLGTTLPRRSNRNSSNPGSAPVGRGTNINQVRHFDLTAKDWFNPGKCPDITRKIVNWDVKHQVQTYMQGFTGRNILLPIRINH